jgi:ketosteroid isomerase-like protein
MMQKSLISLLILCLTALGSTAKPMVKEEEKAVKEAVHQFYEALNALFKGDVGSIKEVWSHKKDVTYMGPAGGFQIGWDQILPYWEIQAARKLGGKVEPVNMHIIMGRDIAIVQNYEKGENFDADGQRQEVSIRASNVFRKENGKWKMISHQTDLLSFLEN